MQSLLPQLRTWAIVLVATACLVMTWATIALAQTDGDSDVGDGDELSGATILLGIGLLAVIGWVAYRGRSTKPR